MLKEQDDSGRISVEAIALAEIAVAIWRIDRRSRRDSATPESVRIACETALDKIRALGIVLKDKAGDLYDVGFQARVVETLLAPGEARVKEYLSPGVYFGDKLILRADIVVQGGRSNG